MIDITHLRCRLSSGAAPARVSGGGATSDALLAHLSEVLDVVVDPLVSATGLVLNVVQGSNPTLGLDRQPLA